MKKFLFKYKTGPFGGVKKNFYFFRDREEAKAFEIGLLMGGARKISCEEI